MNKLERIGYLRAQGLGFHEAKLKVEREEASQLLTQAEAFQSWTALVQAIRILHKLEK